MGGITKFQIAFHTVYKCINVYKYLLTCQFHQKYKFTKNTNTEKYYVIQTERQTKYLKMRRVVAFQTDFYTIDLCLHTKFNNNANTQIYKIPNSLKNANTQIYKITNV